MLDEQQEASNKEILFGYGSQSAQEINVLIKEAAESLPADTRIARGFSLIAIPGFRARPIPFFWFYALRAEQPSGTDAEVREVTTDTYALEKEER